MIIDFHKFKSGKQYVFVKTHTNQKVFLRNIIFLHNTINPSQIVLVHTFGKRGNKEAWEPPKGQMEWKEFASAGYKPNDTVSQKGLETNQRAGILRELAEEAKILPNEITGLERLPHSYKQHWPESGLKDAYFIYTYWKAKVTPQVLFEAQKRLNILKKDRDLKAMLPPDNSEKDGVCFWNPRDGLDILYGDFSKKMTIEYYKKYNSHDV